MRARHERRRLRYRRLPAFRMRYARSHPRHAPYHLARCLRDLRRGRDCRISRAGSCNARGHSRQQQALHGRTARGVRRIMTRALLLCLLFALLLLAHAAARLRSRSAWAGITLAAGALLVGYFTEVS